MTLNGRLGNVLANLYLRRLSKFKRNPVMRKQFDLALSDGPFLVSLSLYIIFVQRGNCRNVFYRRESFLHLFVAKVFTSYFCERKSGSIFSGRTIRVIVDMLLQSVVMMVIHGIRLSE